MWIWVAARDGARHFCCSLVRRPAAPEERQAAEPRHGHLPGNKYVLLEPARVYTNHIAPQETGWITILWKTTTNYLVMYVFMDAWTCTCVAFLGQWIHNARMHLHFCVPWFHALCTCVLISNSARRRCSLEKKKKKGEKYCNSMLMVLCLRRRWMSIQRLQEGLCTSANYFGGSAASLRDADVSQRQPEKNNLCLCWEYILS